jgi:prepilin peptidase CpaA
MQTLIMLLGIGVFAVVAYGDVRTRRIPNELAAAVGALGLARMSLAGDPGAALCTVAASAAVFMTAFLLFRRGLVGGGDVKLLTAASLLVGYDQLLGFLFVMGLCGGLVALAVLAADKLGRWRRPVMPATAIPQPRERRETAGRPSVPYGVAIAAAGVLILVLQSSVPG